MAFDAFLLFKTAGGQPPIEGETQDAVYGPKKAIQLQEFDFEVSTPINISTATAGAGAGKVKFKQLTIKKAVDKASAHLFKYAAAGLRLPEVNLFVRKAGGSSSAPPPTYLVYRLGFVYITDVAVSAASGDEEPLETVTLAYGALQITYTPQKPDGTLNTGEQQMAAWNVLTNGPAFMTQPSA